MKISGKLLSFFIIYNIATASLYAESIQFGKKKTVKKEKSINTAKIKEDDNGVATSSFSNLPKNEVINTFYADPLSDEFMGKDSSIHDTERNRSTKDLLSEFEGQVKVINDNTEIPDEDELLDEHSKEDRARIEARADQLLKEAAIEESKKNSGEALLEDSSKKISDKLNKKEENIASYTELYQETASDTAKVVENENESEDKDLITSEMPEEDPEFSDKRPIEDVVIIEEKASEDNEEIPDYEKLEGIVSEDDNDDSSKANKRRKSKSSSKEKNKTAKKNTLPKEMADPLEPVLLTEGKPKSMDDESEKVYTFSGLIVPEKQLLSRKKYMLRWVLKLEDGTRIPLKSNLKLMQEVRKESNITDFVTISGKMRTSAVEKELRYLVPDSITKGGKIKAEKTNEPANNSEQKISNESENNEVKEVDAEKEKAAEEQIQDGNDAVLVSAKNEKEPKETLAEADADNAINSDKR